MIYLSVAGMHALVRKSVRVLGGKMRKRSVIVLALFLSVLAVCRPAAAAGGQGAAGRWKLTAIHVSGSQRFPEREIAQASGLKLAAMVGQDELQEAAKRLGDSGAFDHVSFRYGPKGGGVEVTFEVTDSPQFVDCRFANLIWIPESQLRTELAARVPLFAGQVSTSGAMSDEIDRALEVILREHGIIASVDHGYFQATMRAPISALVFKAHGPSLPIREVVFTGNRVVDSATLAKTVQPLVGQEYDQVLDWQFFQGDSAVPYFERGYLRVSFGTPQPTLVSGTTSGPLRVTVPITEGLQYNLGGIAWSGNNALSPDDLGRQVHLETGKPANGVELDRDLSGVAELYGTHGYLTAHTEPVPSFDDASRTVNYRIEVSEGAQYHMGQLQVLGIDGEHADLLKHHSKVRPGDPFNASYWRSFLVTNAADIPSEAHAWKKQVKTEMRQESKTVDVTVIFTAPSATP